MLVKTVEKNGRDWDCRLPYVLFAYRTTVQASTCKSPFFLMYGRDARLPPATTTERDLVDLSDFGESLMTNLSEARELAQRAFRIRKRSRSKTTTKESVLMSFE